jgi:hypothetical protein
MNIFTTPSTIGVATRYITVIITTALTVIGMLKWLSPEQVQELSDMLPSLIEAVTGLITIITAAYAVATKARSEKGDAVAKEVDAKIPEAEPSQLQPRRRGAEDGLHLPHHRHQRRPGLRPGEPERAVAV